MENSNQPAFPFSYSNPDNENVLSAMEGLTKREYFAAMAMQGILSGRKSFFWDIKKEDVAEHSAKFADALLTQLNNTK